MTGRRAALVAIVMVAVVGCTSGAEPTASGDTDPQPTPALAVDTVAVVATDDLRVQMLPKPGSEYGSGWLQSGVQLYLVRGPVRADGSDWYQVLPLTQPDEDYGWVAAASPSGEPWIKPLAGVPDCPDTPSTVADLVDLTAGVRLACFRGAPLTVQALLYTVGWRAIPDADDSGAPGPPEKLAPIMLVDPQFNGTAQASALDPASVPTDALSYEEFVQASQDALGAGAVVEVTGMFDHPDAAGCAWNTLEAVADEPDPPYCRPEFVVTGIEATPGASSGPQTAPALAVDTVAVVVADDVMERELPRPEVSDLNERPLPRGLQLYVVGGPVRAGGSEWYQVVGLDEDNDGFGWVRGASPSGEPWITPLVDAPDCPDTPGTVTDLARLTSGVRLACFSGVPITVQALLYTFGWTANPDDPSISGMTSDPPDALAPIMLMDPQGDEIDLALVLDPASVPPDAVNFEAAVEASPGALSPVFEVTGMFDHPDAAGCIWNEREADRIGPEPDPPYCRPAFVVTGIEATSARSSGPGYQEPVELTAGGTATLELTGDADFAPVTNGPVTCWAGSDSVSVAHVLAEDLGEAGGGTLRASLVLESGGAQKGTGDLELWVDIPNAAVGLEQPDWFGSPAVTLNDGQVSGTVEFDGLTMSPDVVDRVRAQWPASLSGKLTWHCEPW